MVKLSQKTDFLFCIQEPGTIDWKKMRKIKSTKGVPNTMPSCVGQLCREYNSAFFLLTDGYTSAMIDNRDDARIIEGVPLIKRLIYSASEYPVRKMLALFIWNEIWSLKIFHTVLLRSPLPQLLHGALNNPAIPKPPSQGASTLVLPQSFRDFDLYTLQRDKDAWDSFSAWKKAISESCTLLTTGDTLQVECNGFIKHYSTYSRSPFPDRPVPPEALEVVSRFSRPRDEVIDTILSQNTTLQFHITKVVCAGRGLFSQVFFGHFGEGLEDNKICLKLFDERLYPKFGALYEGPDPTDLSSSEESDDTFEEDDDIFNENIEPCGRLLDVKFAVDMMCCEEAVYDRLEHLQGKLIPHCYGFHIVGLSRAFFPTLLNGNQ